MSTKNSGLDPENQPSEIITTLDEQGNEVSFELVDVVEVNEQEYGILLPQNPDSESKDDDEEVEAVIMRLKQEPDGYVFETIEDDEEFERVVEAISDLEEDYDEFEDDDEE